MQPRPMAETSNGPTLRLSIWLSLRLREVRSLAGGGGVKCPPASRPDGRGARRSSGCEPGFQGRKIRHEPHRLAAVALIDEVAQRAAGLGRRGEVAQHRDLEVVVHQLL